MNLVCKSCGKKAGGFCCGCDEPTCLPCMVTVKLMNLIEVKGTMICSPIEEYRHRCATCAAVMVLTETNVEATWPTTKTA